MASHSVSIFYPCYNDWGTMGSMIMLTIRAAEELDLDYDITIVDDGSDALSQDLLEEIEARFPKVKVIHHETNRGYGGALRSGFAAATKEWIFYTDGDAQYDVREMKTLLERIGPDVDVVQGYKIERNDPLHRIVIGRIYHWMVKIAFGLRLRDVDCDFRLIRRAVFDTVHLESNSGVICAEMMTKIQRNPRSSLPAGPRKIPVLQLSAHRPRGLAARRPVVPTDPALPSGHREKDGGG